MKRLITVIFFSALCWGAVAQQTGGSDGGVSGGGVSDGGVSGGGVSGGGSPVLVFDKATVKANLKAAKAEERAAKKAAREAERDAEKQARYQEGYLDPTEIGSDVEIGYGSTVKKSNTYSVTDIKVDEVQAVSYSTIFDYMRAKCPGVYIGPAAPGTMPTVMIRGKNSINSGTEPLYIVDGMEVSDITNIRPADVYSIDVLKDASTSIYGVRGANGVIIIRTISGREASTSNKKHKN